MKVITLLNEKGGVGKTTLATHIAGGLAIRGYRVVLVDADPQGNATGALGLDKRPDFYDLTVRNKSWREVLRPAPATVFGELTPKGQLMVVSGNTESRNIANSINNHGIVRRRFSELRDAVDVVVVDTSPTPSLLHAAIAVASNYVIMPTDCDAFATLDGLPESIEHTKNIRAGAAESNIDAAQLLGIIPNKYRATTATHPEVLAYMREQYGDLVWEPINMGIAFTDAQFGRQLLFGVSPGVRATEQMWGLVDCVQKGALNHDTDS